MYCSSFTSLAPLMRRYVAKAFRKECVVLLICWYLSLFFYVIYFVKSVLDFISIAAAVKEQHCTPMPCPLCLLLLIFYLIYSLF